MNEERCILCNRAYEYDKYKLFGRGCLSNLYNLLSISNPPRGTKDKVSVTLNNFAVMSYEYGVIKPYTFNIKFEMNNHAVSEVDA